MIKVKYNLFERASSLYTHTHTNEHKFRQLFFFIDMICILQHNPDSLISGFNGFKSLKSCKSLTPAKHSEKYQDRYDKYLWHRSHGSLSSGKSAFFASLQIVHAFRLSIVTLVQNVVQWLCMEIEPNQTRT